MESEIRPAAEVEVSQMTYFDSDFRPVEPDDPSVARARRITLRGDHVVKVEFFTVKPGSMNG